MAKLIEKDCKECDLKENSPKFAKEANLKSEEKSKKEDKSNKDCKVCDTDKGKRKSLTEKISSLLPKESKKGNGAVVVKNKGPKTLEDVQAKKDRKLFEE
uniref:Uncharacterized protein n=1 Tax=Acrobeloides nanus TaxID=290746 RepID=A0A914ENK1_9BILA